MCFAKAIPTRPERIATSPVMPREARWRPVGAPASRRLRVRITLPTAARKVKSQFTRAVHQHEADGCGEFSDAMEDTAPDPLGVIWVRGRIPKSEIATL